MGFNLSPIDLVVNQRKNKNMLLMKMMKAAEKSDSSTLDPFISIWERHSINKIALVFTLKQTAPSNNILEGVMLLIHLN